MKSNLLLSFLFLISQLTFSQNIYFIKYKEDVPLTDVEQKVRSEKFIPDAVQFQAPVGIKSVDFLAKGLAKSNDVLGRIIKVTFISNVDENTILQLQSLDPSIEYIQKSNTYQMDLIPNDSLVSQQWALEKIQAFDAWDITEGADTVLIGLIDTGIDYNHPDLKSKIWLNPGEMGTDSQGNDKRYNGIDDDNNGFVDDYRGWDFTDRVGFPFDSTGGDYLNWDNDPFDEQGHGTYISGIAAAETNNFTGIAGVAPNIKIVNLRAFDPAGYGEEDDVAAAILYAVQMRVKVLNMSFGDNSFSLVLRDVIQYAYSRNLVLVGSAGNSGSPNPHYPSGYSEVICVGNSTPEDYVSSNSNYGSTIDLVAPGTQIITTARNNNYASINGTSAATPHVSAAVALLLSLSNFTNEEVKQILKTTTDDIDDPGWDLRSGAGRLNLFHALSSPAPSIIKFNHPRQDFSTQENLMTVNATVLSPLFSSYSLYYGYGFNPIDWITLIENETNQFSNQDIYNLNLTTLPDSVYCLRLVVQLTNGRTLEERVNFYVSRTPPQAQLISVGSAFYGDKTTIMAAMITDQPTVTRMYYRKHNDVGSNFNFVTLDGFTTNNQFVKYLHYGFIPRQIVEQNTAYDIYFEAENLVGLKTIVKNNGQYFMFTTNYEAEYAAEIPLSFSLPPGDIYQNPMNLTSNDYKEVFLRKFENSRVSSLFQFNNGSFELVDSLQDRIVRDFGDFNNNGLKDLLTYFVRDGYIYEQQQNNSSSFEQKFSDESGQFWPVMAKDIDGDGKTEVVVVSSDTTVTIWKLNEDLSLSNPITLTNFTELSYGINILDSPNGVLADVNADGINELWFVDVDGDIFSYNILGPNNYQKGSVISTEFIGSSAFIASGDFNGDGADELAVLIHSIDAIDVAPFYRLVVFNLLGNTFNKIYDQASVDASTEFTSSFQRSENCIRFADLDNDDVDELIVFMFPYSYIFKDKAGTTKIISYKENINSNSIFVGDLNNNNVKEIAFPTDQGITFSEFTVSNKANTPYNVSGYSIDSSSTKISWQGNVDQYNIYRGLSAESLVLIDSVLGANQYFDFNLAKNTNYFYAVQAFDLSRPDPYSNLSNIIEIYCHAPGKVDTVLSNSRNTVLIKFTEKMSNTIENLQAFKLNNSVFPNSISPASQFSYLVTFKDQIPVGKEDTLLVAGLRDLYGSPIEPSIKTFNMDTIKVKKEFFISSFQLIDAYNINVAFNLDVDEQTAQNVDNYSFEPDNRVTSATVDANDKRILNINLKGQKPVGSIGREYVMRVKNLISSVDSIPINEGAGSYIVLSGFAKDLSDVYVYPNPVKPENGENLTFANIPRYAKITIWTIDGTKINELEESDGNGGITFNLKDMNGSQLSSGIYFYRIVMLDESKNEKDEKLGKFAVIR